MSLNSQCAVLLSPAVRACHSRLATSLVTRRGLSSSEFAAQPVNEPILDYAKGSNERKELDKALHKFQSTVHKVPIIIGDQELSGEKRTQVMPFDHAQVVAEYSWCSSKQIQQAIDTSMKARKQWSIRPLQERADIMFKAADLCAGKYRADLNASTMLGQAKTIVQAEIDASCELADFLRFNAHFALNLEHYEPISTKESTNKMIYRPLDGFVASISPFNFTAIGGNLASCPAMMGNATVWKPSDTAILSNYVVYKILREAGVPAGVINFVPADGPVFGQTVTADSRLAAVNFTGSVPTFSWLWQKVAERLAEFQSFPRMVGECGGKNFHFVHSSADVDSVAIGTIRSAFEYQGQKCSAASRMFVPESMWPELKKKLCEIAAQIKMGDVREDGVFMSAVIDANSYKRVSGAVAAAKKSAKCELVFGGECDDSKGYFVQPTIIQCEDPNDNIMTQELFGPVLGVFVYADADCDKTLASLKQATPYALTGAVFAEDRKFLYSARDKLRDAVGNLYLNDKCTGSVVGQQPFGGAAKSGTNDKAGGPHYALKWASPQTIKETSVPLREWRYPSMD